MAEELSREKRFGAFFTPHDTVGSLVRWALRKPSDRLLDPSCGDGRFLAQHKRTVGVEQDTSSAAEARARAPWALIHEGDFFQWASRTKERFECAAGNPPFIRYQLFSGETRERALRLCASLGADFSGLASSWAPFLVATASLLKPGGRMAFVVPAEIGHAPYARPLVEFLCNNFADVRLIAVRQKIFSDLSEDVWLLYAADFGGKSEALRFIALDRFDYAESPPAGGIQIGLTTLATWNYRARPFLIGEQARELYREVAQGQSQRLGALAQVGIGYVTGANDFFHVRPSQAEALDLPSAFLRPTVRNGRALTGQEVTKAVVRAWCKRDDPVLLLHLPAEGPLPRSVLRYLSSEAGVAASQAYKCRVRKPWYAVPDVVTPGAFLSYMSTDGPSLVLNQAGCTCTNSVHSVRASIETVKQVQTVWDHPFVRLSCELEGHPLGGGMLKVEPREAQNIVIPSRKKWSKQETALLTDAVTTMRRWRHNNGRPTQELM